MNRRLSNIRHVALDMDGTIYSGGTLFDSTRPFLALLGQLGIGHTFLTNNSSKSAKDYLAHLHQDRHPGQPGPALHLHPGDHRVSAASKCPPCGGCSSWAPPACGQEMEAAGFALTADSATDEPEAVVVGLRHGADLRPAVPHGLLDQPGQTLHRHTPRPHLPDRPAHRAGGLRRGLRRARTGRRAPPGRRAGQARPLHAARHPAPPCARAGATGHGGRPPLHGHGHGPQRRRPGRAGADRRDHRKPPPRATRRRPTWFCPGWRNSASACSAPGNRKDLS